MKKIIITSLLVLCGALSAYAWGPEGHGTICAIAEKNIRPSTKKALDHYLGRGIAFYGVWADEYRSDPRYAYSTHHAFNVDVNNKYVPSKDWMDSIQLIEEACRLIKDRKNQTDSTVTVQIKILIHNLGDIHCPGHVKYCDINTNFKVIPYKGLNNQVSYHSVWDQEIIDRRHAGLSTRDLADDLARLDRKAIKAVQAGTPVDWAEQTAREMRVIYDMAHPGDVLFKEFYNPAWDMVQNQMILGGYRLAAILDEIFK